ncbi:MAG: shikimate kinase [Actinobacteria bacterium]|nr:shikimate kinase [Actinomycetota bacterium]
MERRENLALIGFMGAGKSTVGAALARRLGMDFVDLDGVIAGEAGMSIPEIFDREGEEGFRERESRALRKELKGAGKVLACGGGIVLRPENVDLLRERCLVVYLRVDRNTVLNRVGEGEGRPLLAGGPLPRRVEELLSEREEKYLRASHAVVEAGGRTPEGIAEEIAGIWKESW